ncbi:LysR family transcriptional regulator [Duganella phyllosphaerae]|uniref:HTH-type transcriptional regulator CysL n=1 Tax=Duganella phyllosphaerae TaxID=762836 RepID=A0A1E7WP31_9BURK|nr:LysR family transcriptional regulator [Duganella phyllosphaerae]OFA00921.1 HTH-type transcriptional regulator CysL [Duganella phyllosphaerae]
MTEFDPGWNLYRTLLAVLREGSLSGAARALGLTQPTVGRHIDALEQALGLTLFVRSPAGFAGTEAAQALRPYAETLAATSAAMLRAASNLGAGPDITGTVRLTASEVIGVEVLPPILAALARRHPGITVELALSNRIENLLRRDADIAVRMQRPDQDALVARRLGVIEVGWHARRDYLERSGTPQTYEDLAHHALIGVDTHNAFTRKLMEQMAPLNEAHYALRSNSDLVHLAAIRAGLGVGICQVRLAQRDPALVRVLPDLLTIPLETWLAMHENLRGNSACMAAFGALAEGLSAYINSAADEKLNG